jgi:hypothetical protein
MKDLFGQTILDQTNNFPEDLITKLPYLKKDEMSVEYLFSWSAMPLIEKKH